MHEELWPGKVTTTTTTSATTAGALCLSLSLSLSFSLSDVVLEASWIGSWKRLGGLGGSWEDLGALLKSCSSMLEADRNLEPTHDLECKTLQF